MTATDIFETRGIIDNATARKVTIGNALTSISNNLSVGGDTSVTGELSVAQDTTLSKNLSVGMALSVSAT
ncbi:hypothetical protein, partial [Pseudoalteromonas sp. SIMBA_162]